MCKETKLLLLVSSMFTLAMGLSGVFVNVFFFRETNNFVVVVIYNLMHYIFLPITFIAAGRLSKWKNGILSLRIGLFLFAVFFGLIIMTGKEGIYLIYPLGALFGIASGFYWLAFHTLSFDLTSMDNRDTFNGYNGSCAGIAGAVAPITSGFVISRFQGFKGYYIVFAATLCLFILLVIISMFLKCQSYGKRLDFIKIFRNNSNEWKRIRMSTALWGFRDVVIVFIINILIIETTGRELSLGEFSLIASLVSSAAFVIVQKFIKPSKRRASLFIGAIFSFFAVGGLFITVNFRTLLIYTAMDAFFIPFFIVQLSSAAFNIINKSHEEEFRIEYIINKELVLNLGRIISACILLFLLCSFKNPRILNYFLVFIGTAPLASAIFMAKLKDVLNGTG